MRAPGCSATFALFNSRRSLPLSAAAGFGTAIDTPKTISTANPNAEPMYLSPREMLRVLMVLNPHCSFCQASVPAIGACWHGCLSGGQKRCSGTIRDRNVPPDVVNTCHNHERRRRWSNGFELAAQGHTPQREQLAHPPGVSCVPLRFGADNRTVPAVFHTIICAPRWRSSAKKARSDDVG